MKCFGYMYVPRETSSQVLRKKGSPASSRKNPTSRCSIPIVSRIVPQRFAGFASFAFVHGLFKRREDVEVAAAFGLAGAGAGFDVPVAFFVDGGDGVEFAGAGFLNGLVDGHGASGVGHDFGDVAVVVFLYGDDFFTHGPRSLLVGRMCGEGAGYPWVEVKGHQGWMRCPTRPEKRVHEGGVGCEVFGWRRPGFGRGVGCVGLFWLGNRLGPPRGEVG